MSGVGPELFDHLVVPGVRLVAERLLALEHDHDRAVGVALLEQLADLLHRDHRRGVVGAHRHRLHPSDFFQLRDDDVEDDDEGDPGEDDRHREGADHPGQERAGRLLGGRECVGVGVADWRAHADFTKQKVWAFKPSVVLSSFNSSSTKMRHVMVPPSPCATMLGAADGSVVLEQQRPGQRRTVDALRLGVQIQVVDVGVASGARDLVANFLGVERFGQIGEVARSLDDALGTEERPDPRHGQAGNHDHEHDEQGEPDLFGETHHDFCSRPLPTNFDPLGFDLMFCRS